METGATKGTTVAKVTKVTMVIDMNRTIVKKAAMVVKVRVVTMVAKTAMGA
jgi:hypothetical protein